MIKSTLTLLLCLFTLIIGCKKKEKAYVPPNYMKAQVDNILFYETNCLTYPENNFVISKAYKRTQYSWDDTYPKIELWLWDFSPEKTEYAIGGSDSTTAYYYTSATERVRAISGVINITDINKDEFWLMEKYFSGVFTFTCGDNGLSIRSGTFTSNGWTAMCRSGGGGWY